MKPFTGLTRWRAASRKVITGRKEADGWSV
jgi:hypothetical protein